MILSYFFMINNNPNNKIIITDDFDMINKALPGFLGNSFLKTFDDFSKSLNIDDLFSDDKEKQIIVKIS